MRRIQLLLLWQMLSPVTHPKSLPINNIETLSYSVTLELP